MKPRAQACKGSLVLTMLIVMTAFVVIVHSALRASSYFMLLAREREAFEQKILKNTVANSFFLQSFIFNAVFLGYTKSIDLEGKKLN